MSAAQGVGLEEPDYHGDSEDTVSRSESVPQRDAAVDDHLSKTEGEDKGTVVLTKVKEDGVAVVVGVGSRHREMFGSRPDTLA